MPKKLILNTTIEGCALDWRDPEDKSRDFTNSIKPWLELAEKLESAKFSTFFIADHLSLFDAWKGPGNFEAAAIAGHKIPRVDPSATIVSMAQVTKNLGFGVTFSTISENPYHFARRLASLDLLTEGRVGWNIVSSYLDSSGRQLLNGEPLPEHDKRYKKTSEYLDVVYKLILSSWRDDAVQYDKVKGVFVNPKALRRINHEGEFFKIEGPGVTEPSRQRFPVIIQAGTSSKGKLFAAENAELIYVDGTDFSTVGKNINEIRSIAEDKFGRDPSKLKFIIHAKPILGKTHQDALDRQKEISKASIPESLEIGLSCITGFDLGKYELDDPFDVIVKKTSNGIQGVTQGIVNRALHDKWSSNGEDEPLAKKQKVESEAQIPTKREFLQSYSAKGLSLVGTGEEIADQIQQWVEDYDIDGINFGFHTYPQSIDDLIEFLVPELQKRGLAQTEYTVDGGTFRENVFSEKGRTFVDETHPAHKFRWSKGVDREEFDHIFEKNYGEIKSKRSF